MVVVQADAGALFAAWGGDIVNALNRTFAACLLQLQSLGAAAGDGDKGVNISTGIAVLFDDIDALFPHQPDLHREPAKPLVKPDEDLTDTVFGIDPDAVRTFCKWMRRLRCHRGPAGTSIVVIGTCCGPSHAPNLHAAVRDAFAARHHIAAPGPVERCKMLRAVLARHRLLRSSNTSDSAGTTTNQLDAVILKVEPDVCDQLAASHCYGYVIGM
jgi:hypothetical protein